MWVKRTTYVAKAADDEVPKLSWDIKQVIQHLQEEIKKNNKLKVFLKKQEEEKQKAEQESLMKQHARQIGLCYKMLVVQKRRQKKKRKKKKILWLWKWQQQLWTKCWKWRLWKTKKETFKKR